VRTPFTPDPARPFQLVKFLSWSSLVLILGSSFFLILVIGNYVQQTMMQKDKDFALLLAENLNHQIYQRFTLPTVLGFGRVQLKDTAQYERLDQVVRITIHGFRVLHLQIFDQQSRISYAMDKELLGRQNLSGKAVSESWQGEINFEVIKKKSPLWALFTFDLPAESYILRTTYPLRMERSLSPEHKGAIIGILQFTQDITGDYETITYFQLLIAIIVLGASLLLFLMLYMIIRRADRIIAERIRDKERLERQLHQNEKLASMGRMLATISHEIRNPLGVIQSSAELLHKKAQATGELPKRLTKAIFEEAQRLSQTVNDFLDYARPKQPRIGEVNVTELLQRAVEFLEPELRRRQIGIAWDLPDSVVVYGDKDLLYRALYNVLSNACEAIGDSAGTITLRWSRDRRQLIVIDTGPGFDPTLFDKYVEPFYTSKDTGTGLGLAIVDSIVRNHNGQLFLGTAPEGGGMVSITFPEPEGDRSE
jgi:signal transduction histidine kinase